MFRSQKMLSLLLVHISDLNRRSLWFNNISIGLLIPAPERSAACGIWRQCINGCFRDVFCDMDWTYKYTKRARECYTRIESVQYAISHDFTLYLSNLKHVYAIHTHICLAIIIHLCYYITGGTVLSNIGVAIILCPENQQDTTKKNPTNIETLKRFKVGNIQKIYSFTKITFKQWN